MGNAYARILCASTGLALSLGCSAIEHRRTISLDGTWQVAEGGMEKTPASFDRTVPVPGLMDMAKPAYEQVGVKSDKRHAFWYHRTFAVDGAIPDIATLKVHKAAYGTHVWLNGQDVGEHPSCFTPGLFDLRPHLKGNGQANDLVIRIGASPSELPPGVPPGADFEKSVYTPGIYDSVELILAGSPHIVRVMTSPDIAHKQVRATAVLRGVHQQETAINFIVREAASGKVVDRMSSAPIHVAPDKDTLVDITIPIGNCRLWSPEDPFLYELVVRTDGDALTTRFGMRTFRLDKASGRAILNGKPYYLRGTNVCIFRFFEDASRGDKPWREDWVRRLHRAFRDMHWNSARYCIGFPPESWYRVADELGIMIQDEFPIWYLGKKNWPASLKADDLAREYTEWMRERQNHPCVVIWDAQNESICEPTGQAIQMVRGLDPSNRPWDNGWSAPQSPADSFECHPYVSNNPNARLSAMPTLPPTHLGNPTPNGGHNAMIINEYGWLWLNRDGTPTTLTKKVYKNLLGADATPAQRRHLYARYLAAKTEYWRCSRRFAGVLHFCGLGYSRPNGATSDHFTDLDSLRFDPDFYRYVRDAFSPIGIMVDEWMDDLPAGAQRDIPVVIINDLYELCEADVTFKLVSGDRTISETTRRCRVEPLGRSQLSFHLDVPQTTGQYQIVAELKQAHGEIVHSPRDFEVMSEERKAARYSLSKGKPATTSSSFIFNGQLLKPEFAVDGQEQTRWSSEFSDPQWLAIDLGKVETISRVELLWENAFARQYTIQISTDGTNWIDVYSTDKGTGGKEIVRFSPTQTRHVRLFCKQRGTVYGNSLWEFRVFP